jgi:hypothetical protein
MEIGGKRMAVAEKSINYCFLRINKIITLVPLVLYKSGLKAVYLRMVK